jgi:hypothetical protein
MADGAAINPAIAVKTTTDIGLGFISATKSQTRAADAAGRCPAHTANPNLDLVSVITTRAVPRSTQAHTNAWRPSPVLPPYASQPRGAE